ncbi:hypothetical protein QYE76_044621 [Lolium multiflorum]|uniref:Uncharacterized protein n=1 Tax=Lolium multiflorum TaxID=4521 RepID=A0AAD8TKZ5_LOLMU|nr:hypothetical protein QYE76_044621 [Lolium multiflorum]
MLNHKLKKLNVPTRDVQPSELISNEMERIALMKEAIAKGVYYDMLESARRYDSEGGKENDSDDTEDEAVDNVEEDNEEEEEQEEEEHEEEEEVIEQPQERGQLEAQQVKKKRTRGPTDMKKFWKSHGPHNKAFFNLTEAHKEWVMKSACKKWRAFKCYLKKTFWKAELSVNQNCANGCGQRIHEEQWKELCKSWRKSRSMVLASKNRNTRLNQANCLHTAGTRSFAVVHDQEELRQGRTVSRTELFRIVHTNKDGVPVNDFCATKIALINERFQQNPALVGEPHMDGDLYSELFTPPRNCRRHGFGLLVGGKGSKVLDEAVEALRDSKEENIELRGYVETLMARSQQLEEKVNYLMARQRDGHTDEMHQEREEAVAEELAASTLAELSTHKQAPPEQEQAKEASSAAGRTISASASRASGITSAPSSSHNTMKVPTATTLKSTSAPFKSPFKAPGKGAAYAEKTVQGSATACDQKTEPATVLGSKATTAAAKIPKAGRSAKGSTINGSEAASIPTIPEAAGAANGSTIALKASAAAAQKMYQKHLEHRMDQQQ